MMQLEIEHPNTTNFDHLISCDIDIDTISGVPASRARAKSKSISHDIPRSNAVDLYLYLINILAVMSFLQE